LLNWALQSYDTPKLYDAETAISQVKVYKGTENAVNVGFIDTTYITVPHGQAAQLQPVLETVAVSASGVQAVREAVAQLPRKRSFPANPASAERTLDELDSDALYHEVESILAQVVRTEMTLPAWHKKLDEIVLHPVWGMVLQLYGFFLDCL